MKTQISLLFLEICIEETNENRRFACINVAQIIMCAIKVDGVNCMSRMLLHQTHS